MILVDTIFFNEKKQKIISIKIRSACCKSDFIVIDESPAKLFNPITGEYILSGMVSSIRLAEQYYNEQVSKIKTV